MPIAPIEILSTGLKPSFNAGPLKVTASLLKDLAATFNGPVPFVAGHPPADREKEFELGQATGVAVRGGKLVVTGYRGLDGPVRAIVNSGELNRVSCKLRSPSHPENETGKWKLLHVGLFGRNPTADSEIADVALSAGGADVLLNAEAVLPEFQQADSQPGPDDPTEPEPEPTQAEPTPTPTEEPTVPTPANPPAPSTVEDANLPTEAELAAARAQLEQERRDFELRRAVFDRAQAIAPWLEAQVAAGRVLPGEVALLSAVLSQVPEQDVELRAGDDTTQQVSLTEALKKFVEALPQRVHYSEAAPADPELQAGETETPAQKVRRLTAARYAAARKQS